MVSVIDNFLTKEEFEYTLKTAKAAKWRKFGPGAINRINIKLPFLFNKLCWGEDEDYFVYLVRMQEDLNPSQKWHIDLKGPLKLPSGQEWIYNAIQYIIYLGGDFTGGLLHTRKKTIEPVPNRFVILDPFKEEHIVSPIIGKRYALTGFIYKYKEV